MIKIAFNLSLIMTLLFAPAMILLAWWYRKRFSSALMVWKKSEQVIVTIIAAISSLILFIVGISCFFTYGGYLESPQISSQLRPQFLDVGMICFMSIASMSMIYMAVRILLVQIVSPAGIVLNDKILRVPDSRKTIQWYEITDYYVVPDFPNVIITLIVQKSALKFERIPLQVPSHLRDKFEELIEVNMYSPQTIQARSEASTRHRYSEN